MDSKPLSEKIWDRLRHSAQIFRESPFDGQALQTIVQGEAPTNEKTNALSPPVRCQKEAPIIVAQYVSYANEHLPSYWFGVVPELLEGYGDKIRYEHHDVPVLSPGATSYQLATLGRAIQDEYGDPTFWNWFDRLMDEGVNNIEEGYDLASRIEIDDSEPSTSDPSSDTSGPIDVETLRTAVSDDYYENILKHDMMTLQSRGLDTNSGLSNSGGRLDSSKEQALFAVFVNGNPVQPSYEAIAGGIESLKYGSV